MKSCLVPFQYFLSRLLPVLALSFAGATAMAQSGPALPQPLGPRAT